MTQPTRALSDTLSCELEAYLEEDLRAGFFPVDVVVENAVALIADDEDEDVEPGALRRRAWEMADALTARIASECAGWPPVTDADRLDAAFAELEARGILARHNLTCCGACGAAAAKREIEALAARGEAPRGYAFYHQQDTAAAMDGGGLHLSFGATEPGEAQDIAVGREVVAALHRQGLRAEWDGSATQRIGSPLAWQRRPIWMDAPPTR